MRIERFVVLMGVAVVAACVIATQAILPDEVEPADQHALRALYGPPLVHLATPNPSPESVVEPLVPCPPEPSTFHDEGWIDQLGRRNTLHCWEGRALARAAGIDGELGTSDDICTARAAPCLVVPAR